MQIGLTGGIGCGKSTAAKLFRERGFQIIDTDQIVHDLLAEDEATIAEVEGLFGSVVRKSEGGIDRVLVGERVFSDATLLAKLEAILHPRVREIWRNATSSGENWVIEIPLLFEKNLQKNVDLTVCVFSDPTKQVERLETRGMTRTQAKARIDRQMPLSEKAELADYVLLNDGTLKSLEDQVDRLLQQIETH